MSEATARAILERLLTEGKITRTEYTCMSGAFRGETEFSKAEAGRGGRSLKYRLSKVALLTVGGQFFLLMLLAFLFVWVRPNGAVPANLGQWFLALLGCGQLLILVQVIALPVALFGYFLLRTKQEGDYRFPYIAASWASFVCTFLVLLINS